MEREGAKTTGTRKIKGNNGKSEQNKRTKRRIRKYITDIHSYPDILEKSKSTNKIKMNTECR